MSEEERNGLIKQRRLLREKCKQKDKEIERLNNIINEIKEYLKYQVENLDFEKDTKAKMLGSMILVMLDKEELKEE